MIEESRLRRGAIDAGAAAATVFALPSSEGGGFTASAVDLPGCVATGETEAEALEELRDAIRSWILTAQHFGDEIPLHTSRPIQTHRLPDREPPARS